MIPRYRGKVTGGRPDGHRRRHRWAMAIEAARILTILGLLYLALVCAIGLGLTLASSFGDDLSNTVSGIPVLRQLAIQAGLIEAYGVAVLPAGLALALLLAVAIHFVANVLIDDLVDR